MRHAHACRPLRQATQQLWQDFDRRRWGVAQVQFAVIPRRDGPHFANRLIHPLQGSTGLLQKDSARFGQADGLSAALKQGEAELGFQISVEYFVGMPSFHHLGDPGYQYWLTHTPHGTVVDNPNGLGDGVMLLGADKLRGASGSPLRPIAIPVRTP